MRFTLALLLVWAIGCASDRTPNEAVSDFETSAVIAELPLSECPTTRLPEDDPVAVFRREAYFPIEALHRFDEIRAKVAIAYSISNTGETYDVRVMEFAGTDALNHSAVQAIKSWRFCPLSAGQPEYQNPYMTVFRHSPRPGMRRVTIP